MIVFNGLGDIVGEFRTNIAAIAGSVAAVRRGPVQKLGLDPNLGELDPDLMHGACPRPTPSHTLVSCMPHAQLKSHTINIFPPLVAGVRRSRFEQTLWGFHVPDLKMREAPQSRAFDLADSQQRQDA